MLNIGTIFSSKNTIILEFNISISQSDQFEIIKIDADCEYGFNPDHSKFYHFQELTCNKRIGFLRYKSHKLNAIRINTSVRHCYWKFFKEDTFDNWFKIENQKQVFENIKDNSNRNTCYKCQQPTKILDTGFKNIMKWCPKCKM